MSATNAKAHVDEQLMRDVSAAFNSRNADRIAECFADNAVFYLARGPEPTGRVLRGKEVIRKAMADRFKVIPDMRWEHKEYIHAGDRVISIWVVKGKSADGEELNYQGCGIYRFENRKIVEKDTYWKIVEQKDRV